MIVDSQIHVWTEETPEDRSGFLRTAVISDVVEVVHVDRIINQPDIGTDHSDDAVIGWWRRL